MLTIRKRQFLGCMIRKQNLEILTFTEHNDGNRNRKKHQVIYYGIDSRKKEMYMRYKSFRTVKDNKLGRAMS